jgi:endonuclease YncB( thermonuclease family)
VVIAAAAMAALGLSALGVPDVSGEAAADSSVISAPSRDVAVIDGETLSLRGTVVRLSDLTAPARGQACAAGPDCGGQAAAVLADLVRDRSVECHVSGHNRLGQLSGHCLAGGRDLNVALVGSGWAWAGSPVLSAEEIGARARRRGIWLTN